MENKITENAIRALDLLQVPNPFRELIVFMSGLGALVFLQLATKFDIISIISYESMGRIERDFIILILTYLIGKLMLTFANIINFAYKHVIKFIESILLNPNPFKTRFHYFRVKWGTFTNCKINLSELINPIIEKPVSAKEAEKEISVVEISQILSKNPGIKNEKEALIQLTIFLRISYTAFLIAVFLVSKYYLPIFILIFLWNQLMNRKIRTGDYMLFRDAIKEIGKNSKNI